MSPTRECGGSQNWRLNRNWSAAVRGCPVDTVRPPGLWSTPKAAGPSSDPLAEYLALADKSSDRAAALRALAARLRSQAAPLPEFAAASGWQDAAIACSR